MPRNGSGVAERLPNTNAVAGQTIESADFENSMNDIYSILNTAVPIAYLPDVSSHLAASDPHTQYSKEIDTPTLVTSITALKALDTTKFSAAYLTTNLRHGKFIWRTGNYSAAVALDTLNGIYVKADAIAATSGCWVRAYDWAVESSWFGAMGDGTTDDGDALDAALDLAHYENVGLIYSGLVGSTFYRTTQHVIDLFGNDSSDRTQGLIIQGAGNQRTRIDVRDVATSPQARIICSGGTTGSPIIQANAYLERFGFLCDTAGVGLEIGAHDFSEQMNRTTFDLTVTNDTNGATSCAVEINALYHCYGVINATLGGTITAGSSAIRVRKMAFSHMSLGGSNADAGIHLTSDYVYGNQFNILDSEIVNYGVLIDGANITDNLLLSGTSGYSSLGYVATAGARNRVLNPNINSAQPVLSTNAAFRVGLQIDRGEFIGYNGLVQFGNHYDTAYEYLGSYVSGNTIPAPADGINLQVIFISGGPTAALTITLPASPANGLQVAYHFINPVTALTVAGGSVFGGAPTSVSGIRSTLRFRYLDFGGAQWIQE